MTARTVQAEAWLQVEPKFGPSWSARKDQRVQGAKIARMTSQRPTKPVGGTVLVRVLLDVPASVFEPIVEARIAVDAAETEVTVKQGEVE